MALLTFEFFCLSSFTFSKKSKNYTKIYLPASENLLSQEHAASVLAGVCNAIPLRYHQYTSFSFAALSSFCSTQLLYLLITAQHCCEAILFDRLVIFFFFFFEKPTSKLRDLGMKSCRAVQHYTYNTFLLLYFYFFNKKIYYFCSVDLMLFTQYINNNSVVYIRILDYLFII